MQICMHRKDNSPKPVNHHLTLKENMTTSEDFHAMISYKLVSHCKLLGSIISEVHALLSLAVLI